MRVIDSHKVAGSRSNVDVVEIEPNRYEITLAGGTLVLDFAEGLTNEALLAILEDRIRQQVEQVFDGRSGGARLHCFRALGQLKARTVARIDAGIEGSKNPTPGATGQR